MRPPSPIGTQANGIRLLVWRTIAAINYHQQEALTAVALRVGSEPLAEVIGHGARLVGGEPVAGRGEPLDTEAVVDEVRQSVEQRGRERRVLLAPADQRRHGDRPGGQSSGMGALHAGVPKATRSAGATVESAGTLLELVPSLSIA